MLIDVVFLCELLLVGLCIVACLTAYNFWFVMLNSCWFAVCTFVGWPCVIVVIWPPVLLYIIRVYSCWLAVFIVYGCPCGMLLVGCEYCCCLAV